MKQAEFLQKLFAALEPLSAEEREIGGLGIYIVKKNMDAIFYEYKNGRNILTIKKNME